MIDYLDSLGCTLIVLKEGKTLYRSNTGGLKPLLHCINECGADLQGAVVIDKVAGLAAAKLYSYAKVAEVFTGVASHHAVVHMNTKGIPFHYKTSVPNILDAHKQEICPMERLGVTIEDDTEFFTTINERLLGK